MEVPRVHTVWIIVSTIAFVLYIPLLCDWYGFQTSGNACHLLWVEVIHDEVRAWSQPYSSNKGPALQRFAVALMLVKSSVILDSMAIMGRHSSVLNHPLHVWKLHDTQGRNLQQIRLKSLELQNTKIPQNEKILVLDHVQQTWGWN